MASSRVRVAVASFALLLGIAMGVLHSTGLTRDWAEPSRLVYALALSFGLFGGFGVLFAELIGLFDETAQIQVGGSNERTVTGGLLMAVYLGSMAVILVAAALLWQLVGVPFMSAVLAGGGALLLVASTGRPWWLYATFRSLGWFAAVRSERVIRLLMVGFGGTGIAAALLAGAG